MMGYPEYKEGHFKVFRENFSTEQGVNTFSARHYPLRVSQTRQICGVRIVWRLSVNSAKGTMISCSGECGHVKVNFRFLPKDQILKIVDESYTRFKSHILPKIESQGITFLLSENLIGAEQIADQIYSSLKDER